MIVPTRETLGGLAALPSITPLSSIFRRWREVISPFVGSNESTARPLSGPNMSAWRKTADGQ